MRGERLLGTPNVLFVHGEDGCTKPGYRKFQQMPATVNRDLVRVRVIARRPSDGRMDGRL